MNDKPNSFKLLLEEDRRSENLDHREIQTKIHNRLGTLKFMGHIADMYLNKFVQAAGMKLGGQFDDRTTTYNRSDEYGPAGPAA